MKWARMSIRRGQLRGGFRKSKVSNLDVGAAKAASMANYAREQGHDVEVLTLPSIKEKDGAKAVYVQCCARDA